MTTSLRDRTLGAGYDYQWDVALYVILHFVVLNRQAAQPQVRDALAWLGEIEEVTLEGSESTGELEDLTLRSATGRELQIQVKESDPDVTKGLWRPSTPGFRAFLERAARRPSRTERLVLFLTNGSIHADVETLLTSRNLLADLHAKLFGDGADEETSVANWQQVRASEFLDATPVDDEVASAGVGLKNVHALDELGVPRPGEAYARLWREVARWSYRSGGTTMSANAVRAEIRRLLGRLPGSPGSLLMTLVDRLRDVPQDLPSRSTFELGRVWVDAERVHQVVDCLETRRLALIVGGRGTGKTVLSRSVGLHLVEQGWCPVYWDFEHLGKLPQPVGEVWQYTKATARLERRKPALILENAHLDQAGDFASMLGLLEASQASSESMIVLATARNRPYLAPSMQARVDEASLHLASSAKERGALLLQWWLECVLRLDDEAMGRAYRAVPWRQFTHDLLVLSLALEAFEPAAGTLTTERIEAALEARLARTIAAVPGADDALYLVAVLGAHALATDLRALGCMLGQPADAIRAITDRAMEDGLLSLDAQHRTCRFWHESLAAAYLDVFQWRRTDWAASLRAHYRSST